MLLLFERHATDTTKRLMSSPKCRSVEVINNPARPGSNHREVNKTTTTTTTTTTTIIVIIIVIVIIIILSTWRCYT
jgi:hypothetical protein